MHLKGEYFSKMTQWNRLLTLFFILLHAARNIVSRELTSICKGQSQSNSFFYYHIFFYFGLLCFTYLLETFLIFALNMADMCSQTLFKATECINFVLNSREVSNDTENIRVKLYELLNLQYFDLVEFYTANVTKIQGRDETADLAYV